jgi:hypothetical protein
MESRSLLLDFRLGVSGGGRRNPPNRLRKGVPDLPLFKWGILWLWGGYPRMGGVAQRLLLWNLAYIPVSDHEYTNETWFARIYSCIRGLELDCKQIPDRSASRNARPA